MMEMMAVIALLGIIAAVMVPRLAGNDVKANRAACHTNIGNIEIQAELWHHNTGGWPATNLSDIGADLDYFTDGIATCPVDGAPYAIDAAGRVVGHTH
ncbi:hypothetical protein HG15A2_26790 [Adhaeretor mobilis]|uniref:Uncharacterized protein n=2 Tax=Adhaeretor mobilis TaxID=1930276 RepID=A0A517MWV1_9BACT|nr:hypothetical protein HG15A2_26790 [Adhaeretor mobilis]